MAVGTGPGLAATTLRTRHSVSLTATAVARVGEQARTSGRRAPDR
jgi:hypothetical protein